MHCVAKCGGGKISSMRMDHVAYPCRDPRRTHNFYNRVLGLRLVQAYAGEELMLIYHLSGGGSIVFSAARDQSSPPADDVAWERRHVGITVATRGEFERWLSLLKQHEIEHQLVEDERIYFADPDGLVMEIEVESAVPVNPEAEKVLELWMANNNLTTDPH
jgi:catechol 2,3-dioxygenase-like lactoylglutathione lyase family enzyme